MLTFYCELFLNLDEYQILHTEYLRKRNSSLTSSRLSASSALKVAGAAVDMIEEVFVALDYSFNSPQIGGFLRYLLGLWS